MYSSALARDDLEALEQRLGLRAPMGLDDADDDIVAVLQSGARLLQHLVGLADAGRRTEENLELAGAALLPPGRFKQGIRRRALVRITPLICHAGIESLRGI